MKEANWPIFIAAPFICPERVHHPLGRLHVALLEFLVFALPRQRPTLRARVPA